MITLKSFSIFKARESDNEKAPTHKLSAKIGEEFVDIGSAWTKDSKKGDKYLSVQLAKAWVDHTDNTKTRKSVVLVFEEDLKALFARAGEDYVNEDDVPATKPTKAPTKQDSAF